MPDSVSYRFSHWRPFLPFARLALFILSIAAVAVLLLEKWRGACVLSVLLVLSVFVVRSRKLPPFVAAVFMSATLLDAGGYALNLYQRFPAYDEVAHLYNGFAVTLGLGLLLLHGMLDRFADHRLALILSMTCVGLGIGVAWELSEWLADLYLGTTLLGGLRDTMTDLALDGVGAFFAGVVAIPVTADRRSGSCRRSA